MSNSTLPPILNPLDPFALLPPDIAREVSISFFLSQLSGGIWLGDFLNGLYEEYVMLSKHRRSYPDIAYVVSRLACLGLVIADLVLTTSQNSHVDCHAVNAATTWMGALSISFSSLLFWFRIRAVFYNSPIIVGCFFVLWMGTCISLAAPWIIVVSTLRPSSLCIIEKVATWNSVIYILVAAHDTLVFFAISIRLALDIHQISDGHGGMKKSILHVLRGGYKMSNVAKALLSGGQLYYLVTIGVNIGVAIVILISGVPVGYRSMLNVVDTLLQNAMACRVYRQLKIGLIRGGETSTTSNQPILPSSRDVGSGMKFGSNSGITKTVEVITSNDVQLDTFILHSTSGSETHKENVLLQDQKQSQDDSNKVHYLA